MNTTSRFSSRPTASNDETTKLDPQQYAAYQLFETTNDN